MNPNIIPSGPQKVSKHLHLSNLDAWRNFAQRITKNSFVKKFLLDRDGTKCSWCNRQMETSTIHHVSYNHVCTYTAVITVRTPTEKRPHRTRVVPDCESCKKNNSEGFLSCMSKLTLVHSPCNKSIAEQTSL
jgi:hypothetical protein